MIIRFEKWYEENIIENSARELFLESCLCYKVGAYRSAFLMTYLGFQNVLKEKIKKYVGEPAQITVDEWNGILNGLDNENKWEETVCRVVDRSSPNNIFLINDDLRKQHSYFRCIRNDCAHARSNIIGYSHVETLWLFIESNYNKFVINGGRNGLKDRIQRYYNRTKTKPGSDITPIVNDIMKSMMFNEIHLFFDEIYEWGKEEFYFNFFEVMGEFWDKIIFNENGKLREALYEFIKKDSRILIEFIDRYPKKILDIFSNCNEEFKREFWNVNLLTMITWDYENSWEVLECIVRNEFIPEDEIEDFFSEIVKKNKLPPEDKVEFLKNTPYFKLLEDKIFNETNNNFRAPSGIDYANYNWNIIRFLIINVALTKLMVKQLNDLYLYVSFGRFNDGFTLFLEKNIDFRNEYKSILEKNNWRIPDILNDI